MGNFYETTICPRCGGVLVPGAWPFCESPGGHGSVRSAHAQGFDPVVVHVDASGNYRFPAATDAPVPEGYQKVEIRSIQEADRISREVNAREDATLREVERQTDASRTATRARNQAFMNSIRERMSPAGRKFLDGARAYQEQKDRERGNSRPRSTNFYMDVFANDSSNREVHSDERTGWKSRKG